MNERKFIVIFFILALSGVAFGKTVYFNMSWSPITMPPWPYYFGFGNCSLVYNVSCDPYPIDFYNTFSTAVAPPISTSTKVVPYNSNTYCLFYPGSWMNYTYCTTSPPSTTTRAGRGFAIDETGTIPAGQWRISVNTSSTTSNGVGYILVYVWRICAVNVGPNGYETDTLLFRAQGTTDVVTAGNTITTITTTQPSFWFGKDECYLIAEYFLNTSVGSGDPSSNVTLVGGIMGSNLTYPTPVNLINNVTLNSPETDLVLDANQTFIINCTPNTDDSLYGINMSFEYNTSTSGFAEIPTSGGKLTANAGAQANVRNSTSYSRVITAVSGDDYYVRCRAYNASGSVYSIARKVSVKEPAQVHIANFRIYQSSDMSQIGVGKLVCSDFSWPPWYLNIFDNWTCSSLALNTPYRVEIRVCNDAQFGKDANITAVVHGNLTADYIGVMGSCATGDGNLTPVSCSWNVSERNGVYINATGITLSPGSNQSRNDSTCQWFAYNFTVANLKKDSSFVSNITTLGVTSGANPVIKNITIGLSAQSAVISDFNIYRSSNMTQLGVGERVCNFTSPYGSSLPDSNCTNKLLSRTQYRAEIRVCNDRYPGFDLKLVSLVHSNLSADYVNILGSCATGDGNLTPVSCYWNSTDRGIYMDASAANLSASSARDDSSCQWFAYSFTTGSLRNDSSVNSSIRTIGVNYGKEAVVGKLVINITPQYLMNNITLVAPASNLTLINGTNFTMSCTPSTGGGYNINVTFEYNTPSNLTWRAIPNSTDSFWIDGKNPEIEVSNGVLYAHTVTANAYGVYNIRCRMNNASTSLYSEIREISVYPAYLNITINYPSPDVYNSSNPFVVGQDSTFTVNSSLRCSSLGAMGDCGNVTCSIRYNQTSATPNSLVSGVEGAKPFYIVSERMTHDFNGVTSPSANHQAILAAVINSLPPTQLYTSGEASSDGYARIGYEDGMTWNLTTWFGLPYNFSLLHQFRFQITESVNSIRSIKFYYKGGSSADRTVSAKCDTASYLTRMYVWNFSSNAWSYIGSHSSPFIDNISGEFTTGFADIVSSNYLYLLVASDLAEPGCNASISTDFVKLDVEVGNSSVLPCGKVMSNQTCNFAWLVNATGVNEIRTVDVNCSTDKSTINASDSNDTYVRITGVEVHTDKGNYRSCGAVYYQIRVYDSEGRARDENVSIRIYDPSGAIVNESRVQTVNGIFQSTHILPPGSALGRWLIKAVSCAAADKSFYVGIGNATEFWKVEVIQPEKVRFAPGEQIPITLRFYNQAGDAVRVFGLSVRVDNTGYGCTYSNGAYNCLASAPSSAGVHSLNILAVYIQTGRLINETRYFYVGG